MNYQPASICFCHYYIDSIHTLSLEVVGLLFSVTTVTNHRKNLILILVHRKLQF
jgi:hypothetical protein